MKYLSWSFALLVLLLSAATGCSVSGVTSSPLPESYSLQVANSETVPVEVTENVTGKTFQVKAGEDAAFEVKDQPKDKADVEREFTVKVGDKTKTFKSRVADGCTILIDPSEKAVIAYADYGGRYRSKQEIEVREHQGYKYAPEDLSTIQVRSVFRDKGVHFLPKETPIDLKLGEPTPKEVKTVEGEEPHLYRLIRMPPEVLGTEESRFEYLVTH